jgi:hypothetical protein
LGPTPALRSRMADMPWPERLRTNAWAGGTGGVEDSVGADAARWSRRSPLPPVERHLFADEPADPRDWQDPRVGWGLVLPENDQVPATERATAVDAAEPFQRLVAARPGAPVLRVPPDRFGRLRRYRSDGSFEELDTSSTEFGVAEGHLPRYLLLAGSVQQIPWDVQYLLNARFAVGRLDLDDDGLDSYVTALLDGWSTAASDPFKPLVWATQHGDDDITALMKRVVARPIHAALHGDPDIGDGAVFLGDGAPATVDGLVAALTERRPGLIVTTSHGATGGPGAPPTVATLGLPLDDAFAAVTPSSLLGVWAPDGAIWYAHACASAGSGALTVFSGLFDPAGEVGKMLSAVAGLGDNVAPLPRALLGHPKPLRAFVGHVEPTFDWTIAAPDTAQPLTAGIREAAHDRLYRARPEPVGLAFGSYFDPIASLAVRQEFLRRKFNEGVRPDQDPELLAVQLAARDRMSTVILGDPTVVVHRGAHP